ncbi:hypothetical protein SSCG_04257 [Streptomyces clavuligerus]|nr:hypothetical protein SSCG_04257 [Streptomyces clavuligerus]
MRGFSVISDQRRTQRPQRRTQRHTRSAPPGLPGNSW